MNKLTLITIIFALLLSACKDVVEPDIGNVLIELLSPPDSLHTSILSQTFWWAEVEGARTYNLQIVKPTFGYTVQLIYDTNITMNTFSASLTPGTYQWRIRAENNGYETQYQQRTLFIDSSGDINSQFIVLMSPSDNYITNDPNIIFQWDPLSIADEYRFRLLDSLGNSILDTFLTQTTLSLGLYEDQFKWQVKGENNFGSTGYSSRNLTIDITPPNPPTLMIPPDKDTVSSINVALSWHSDPSSISDSLLIYNDSIFTSVVYSGLNTTSTYTFTGQSNHHYYWRLKSADSAGNWSLFTSLLNFYIP